MATAAPRVLAQCGMDCLKNLDGFVAGVRVEGAESLLRGFRRGDAVSQPVDQNDEDAPIAVDRWPKRRRKPVRPERED